jgi:Leucine-rich repeat (LRR) protein
MSPISSLVNLEEIHLSGNQITDFGEINKLETTKVEDNKYVRYEEYFHLFLMVGLALFIFSR